METKSARVLQILRENPDKVFTRRELVEAYRLRYNKVLAPGSVNRILETTVKPNCLRSPKQTTHGYLYTLNDRVLLQKEFERYLLPNAAKDSRKILALMQRQNFDTLREELFLFDHAWFFALLSGFIIGDGNLRHPVQTNYCIAFFLFLPQDASALSRDLRRTFLVSAKITSRGNCQVLTFSDKVLYLELLALGTPCGNKVRTKFYVPNWIYQGERELKRSFLKGIFGAEGSKPFNGKWRIQFVLSKHGLLLSNLLVFLNQVRSMLNFFGITTSNIQVRSQPGRSFYGRFYVTGRENVLRFHQEIGYAYASEKQSVLDELVNKYLKAKSTTQPCAMIR
jgi:DNA-binding transcriptional regulator WhiA